MEVLEKEQENLRLFYASLNKVTERPSGNAGQTAWTVYETRMATLQGRFEAFMPTTAQTGLSYNTARDQMMFNWATLLLNNPMTAAFAQRIQYGKAGPGGRTMIQVGNRTSTGSGSASGDSDYELYMSAGDHAPIRLGDGPTSQGHRTQQQLGDGQMGQTTSRPIQNNAENGTFDSQGFDAGFSTP